MPTRGQGLGPGISEKGRTPAQPFCLLLPLHKKKITSRRGRAPRRRLDVSSNKVLLIVQEILVKFVDTCRIIICKTAYKVLASQRKVTGRLEAPTEQGYFKMWKIHWMELCRTICYFTKSKELPPQERNILEKLSQNCCCFTENQFD